MKKTQKKIKHQVKYIFFFIIISNFNSLVFIILDSIDLKSSDPESNISSPTVKSEQQNKTKSVYSFTTFEDLNLTMELDVLATPYIKNDVKEENTKENKAKSKIFT